MRGVEIEMVRPEIAPGGDLPAGAPTDAAGADVAMAESYFLQHNKFPRHAKVKVEKVSSEENKRRAQQMKQQERAASDARLDRLEATVNSLVGVLSQMVNPTSVPQAATAAPAGAPSDVSQPDPTEVGRVKAQDQTNPVPAPTSQEEESSPVGDPVSPPMGFSGVPADATPMVEAKEAQRRMVSTETSKAQAKVKSSPSTPAKSEHDATPESNDWDEPAPALGGVEEVVQQRIDAIKSFLSNKDPHKFFRSLLTNSIHRQVSYYNWPNEMQADFDHRFQQLLENDRLYASLVKTVLTFGSGDAVGDKALASLITLIAGVVAFYMGMVEA